MKKIMGILLPKTFGVGRFFIALGLCIFAFQMRPVFAVENFHGVVNYVDSTDLSLVAQIKDWNDPSGLVMLHAKACWDDSSFTQNCDILDVNYPETPGVIPTVCSPHTAACVMVHYIIPTGSVGGVTPRDGLHHLIYLKILSQQNPGAGDVIVDGSPFPFTFANGTVDRMWPLVTEASPARLAPAQLAVFANSQDPYSVGAIGATVCTISGTPVKNDGAVGYYVQKRGIPCANIRMMSFPVPSGAMTSMSEAIFDAVILPSIQSLPPTIQAIAVGWVAPGMIVPTGGGAAHTGLQSLLHVIAHGGVLSTGTQCIDPNNATANFMGQTPFNPYFNTTSKTPFTDFGIRPAMFLAAAVCPTCTASNNYGGGTIPNFSWNADFPTLKSVIDAGAAATDTNPAAGIAYWSVTGDFGRSQAAYALSANVLGTPSVPNHTLSPRLANALRLGSLASPHSSDVSSPNILTYVNGAPHWNYVGAGFISGAGMGWATTSASGAMPYDGNQTPALSWLNQGAVAAAGATLEPCELFLQKLPDATILIPNYTQGQTAIEALWKSVRITHDLTVVGDPLASPFGLTAGGTPPPPSLTLTKTADVQTARSGDLITFTIHYQNDGKGNALNAVVTDPVPAGTSLVPNTISGAGTLTAGNIIQWNLGTVLPADNGSLIFQVQVN